MRLFAFIVFLIFVNALPAAATTYTWVGGASGNWNTASNWSPNSGYPGKIGNSDIAVVNTSGCAITITATLTISQLETTSYGISGITVSVSSGNTLTISSGISTAQPSSAANVFTFSGAGTTKIGGSITAGYNASFATASGATVYLTATAVVDEASGNPHGSFNNAGTLNILSGATLKFSDQSQLVNSGTINSYNATLTFSGSGSPTCGITNTGTILDHGSTMTYTGQGATFQNSSAGSQATLHGTTINFSAGSNNQSISNSGTFTIDSAATINAGTFTAYISNSGTFNAGTSNSACTINLTGQSSNITNNSSGSFNLGSTSVINFGGFSAYLSNSGTFTLKSDAYGSGAIGTISNSAYVTGTFTVQRYLQGGAGYRNYRLLSSPVYAATVSSVNVYSINYLKNSIYLTGTTTTGGFDNIVAANPTLYLYRENQTSPAFTTFLNSNFIGIKAINNVPTYAYSMNDATYTSTYNIPVGSGYLCFFRGDRSTSFASKTTSPFPAPENTTLSTSGTINTGTITLRNWFNPGVTTLSYTASTPIGYRGFNLAGNPYPSTIDWETYQSTNTGAGIYGKSISSSIYELNPKTQNYDVYQYGGAFTNYGTRYIMSGQAFFVLASGSTSSLTFYETAKAPTHENTGLYLFMGAPNTQAASTQHLKLQLAQDTVNTDDTYIGFGKNLNSLFDLEADAPYKAGTGRVSLSSFSADNVSLAINKQPLPKGSSRIKLAVNTQNDGIYSLSLKEITQIPQLYDVWLMDAYKKDSLDLRHNPAYRFNVYKSDTNTYGANRFSLVIRENAALAYRLLNFTAVKTGTQQQGVQINWVAENEQNYTNFTVERSIDGGKSYQIIGSLAATGQGSYGIVDNSPASQNLYRLQSQNIDDLISYSPVVPVSYADLSNKLAKSNINLYPNPASSTINLNIRAAVANNGKFNIQISNSSGLLIRQATSATQNWQADVSNLQPGTYLVRVVNSANQTEIGSTKFVKM